MQPQKNINEPEPKKRAQSLKEKRNSKNQDINILKSAKKNVSKSHNKKLKNALILEDDKEKSDKKSSQKNKKEFTIVLNDSSSDEQKEEIDYKSIKDKAIKRKNEEENPIDKNIRKSIHWHDKNDKNEESQMKVKSRTTIEEFDYSDEEELYNRGFDDISNNEKVSNQPNKNVNLNKNNKPTVNNSDKNSKNSSLFSVSFDLDFNSNVQSKDKAYNFKNDLKNNNINIGNNTNNLSNNVTNLKNLPKPKPQKPINNKQSYELSLKSMNDEPTYDDFYKISHKNPQKKVSKMQKKRFLNNPANPKNNKKIDFYFEKSTKSDESSSLFPVNSKLKKEREKMKGHKCEICQKFYENFEEEAKDLCQECSRHRTNQKVTGTPKDFYNLDL